MSDAKLIEVKDGSFEWAKLQLQKGKAVRRQSWPWRHYLKLNKSTGVIYDCYYNDIECIEADKYEPTSEDVVANDWIVSTNENKK